MTVLGVGLDIVDIDSFSDQLGVTGSAFESETFTHAELDEAARVASDRPGDAVARSRRLAGRFAAKEAFLKAWSSARVGRAPAVSTMRWTDVEVLNDPWGRPFLRPSGSTATAVVESLGSLDVHLSITHDGPVAAAVVVLSSADHWHSCSSHDSGQGR